MKPVILEARSAREGGGLTLTAELFPRVTNILEKAGREVVAFVGPPSSARDRAVRRRIYSSAAAILHAGNRATFSRARRVVVVQDRLLLEPDLPRVNNTPRYRVRRSLLVPALRVADVVVVPTNSMLEPLRLFRRRFRIPERPTEVILHGSPSWEGPVDRPIEPPLRMLFASHALWHKNFPLLAKLMARARTEGRDHRLTITGSAEQPVAGRRLGDWFAGSPVDFVGTLGWEALPGLYSSHDVLLFPSLYESFGLPLVEAMVMNMPVIASDRGWAREVAGDAAHYADPDDAGQWLSALDEIASRGIRANPSGLDRARAFDWDAAAARYASLLDPSLRLP